MKSCSYCGITEEKTRIINHPKLGFLCRKHYLQYWRDNKIKERTIYDKNNITINEEYAIIDLYDKNCNKISETMIDKEDVQKISNYKWYLSFHNGKQYVTTSMNGGKKFLHDFILEKNNNNFVIDHINGNTLDNRKNNIRICTTAENSRNRVYKKSKCNFPGVYQQYGEKGRWTARICYNYKTIHLGTFDTYDEAKKARLEAEKKYFCKFSVHFGQLK